MNHSKIEAEREKLIARYEEIQQRWEEAETRLHFTHEENPNYTTFRLEADKLGQQLDKIDAAIEALDLTATDPAAHGFELGE